MDEEREGMMMSEEKAEMPEENTPQEKPSISAEMSAEGETSESEETGPEEVLIAEDTTVDDAVARVSKDETGDLIQTGETDKEAEIAAHLGEGKSIEEISEAQPEPAKDMTTADVEEALQEAEVKPRKPKRGKVEETSARLIDEGVPDFSQVPQADGESDGRAWYVVHCYSGYENKVRHNLEQRIESMGMKNQIFDVVVPTEEEIEVKEGKRRTVERRVFPGYILVNMVLTEESWYVVRNTPGVTSFVGQGNTPLPLRPEEVSQIVKRMEAEAPRIKVSFKQGERVRIVDGPFNDFRGTVSEIDMERAKVRVMVNFFGRETPVELDFLQVEKS
jgi:transcriptional antiterminator NusG